MALVLCSQGLLLGFKMKNKNGKWNLDDLVKNPSKQVFDKRIKEIERYATQFEKQKNMLIEFLYLNRLTKTP